MIALSHSRISTLTQCPRKFYHVGVLKEAVQEQHPAAVWGVKIHEQLEKFFLNGTPVEDGGYQRQADGLKEVLQQYGYSVFVELPYAWDLSFAASDWRSRSTVFRAQVDLLALSPDKQHAVVLDWKTGKGSSSERNQLEWMALAVFLMEPVTEITAMFRHLDLNTRNGDCNFDKDCYTKFSKEQDFPRLLDKHRLAREEIDRREATQEWEPRASYLCRFCPLSRCEFHP